MSIESHAVEPHWIYMLAIERDLERLSRYIEFAQANYETFGLEIARLLLACGAEADVVCKQVCQSIDPQSKADNIHSYRDEIVAAYPRVPAFEVILARYGITLHPWDEWNKPNGTPFWWTAYNKIKHERDRQFQRANIKNALNAFAGLFIMVLYLYKEKAELGELVPAARLVRVGEPHFGGTTMGYYEMGINYILE